MTTNPVKVIREKCLRCCCDSANEVTLCHIEACPLWPWRMGKNPYRKKKVLTNEQKLAMTERLRKAREKTLPMGTENFEDVSSDGESAEDIPLF